MTRLDVNVILNPNPSTPVLGLITQPTCLTATGTIALSGLPSSGAWIITESPGATTNSGTGTTKTFSNVGAGTYTFTVTNSIGCTSAASNNFTFNSPPLQSTNKELIVNVLLEGFFNQGTNAMNITLNDNSLIPLNQPYQDAPWNYAGGETIVSVPAGVIDWILVELRAAATPAEALPATVLSGWPRAYLLKSNGAIVDLDGITPPTIGNPLITGNLYAIISHRNHVSIMSNTGMAANCNDYTYNFTDAITKAYGYSAGYKQLTTNLFGMVSGDADGDGNISVLDFSKWATDFGKTTIYISSDIDGDGTVSVLDFSRWATNFGVGNIVPLKMMNLQTTGSLPLIKYKSQVPGNK